MSDNLRSGSLPLLPSEWRDLLQSELIAVGVGRDIAGLVARRVIECLVRSYLSGHCDAIDTPTRSLEEAA